MVEGLYIFYLFRCENLPVKEIQVKNTDKQFIYLDNKIIR